MGAGNYPAKYSFYPTNVSCGDFVVFNTGGAGSSTQASIVAYDNLYTGTCTGPTTYWAYNTGGTISTSVVLSYFGDQVAFMQLETITMSKSATATATGVALTIGGTTGYVGNTTNGSAVVTLSAGTLSTSSGQTISGSGIPSNTTVSSIASATLNILRWKASSSETFAAPATPNPESASNYYNCSAPCMVSIPFASAANDANSSPFYDYLNDILYVGDSSGKLHKFTPVFKGTPAETSGGTTGWPITVSAAPLTSPVYDSGTGYVFVADSGGSGGYLYSYLTPTSSTAPTFELKTSRLINTSGAGIVDGPVVDSSAKTVYVFVGDDANTNTGNDKTCQNGTGCNGVFQFSTTTTGTGGSSACNNPNSSGTGWPSGSTCGSESFFGAGTATTTVYAGTFDNTYYAGTGLTGNLWTCGSGATSEPRLEASPVGSFSNAQFLATTAYSSLASAAASCSPVTEIYNSSTDYIYLSVTASGSLTHCTGSCLYSFTVASTGSSATVSAGLNSAGGTSGIIIDNTGSGGGSQIYFSYLTQATSSIACPAPSNSTAGGCAVQASQAALR